MAYKLAYLVDCSGSMGNSEGIEWSGISKLELAKDSLIRLFRAADSFEPADTIWVLAFRAPYLNRPEVEMLVEGVRGSKVASSSSASALAALESIEAAGGTPMGKALAEALKLMDSDIRQNKGILVITDGFSRIEEDPRLYIHEALLKRVRIDIAGIGKTAGTEELASLAEKTGGHFRKALSLEEAYAAVRWQRPSFSSPDGLAVHQLLGEVLSMREELASLERSFSEKSIDNPEYSERKKEMAKRIKALAPQINAVRDRLSREIAGLIAERQVPLISMTSLKAAFERDQIGRKIYLERISDATKTLAEVNRRIEAKQHLLDSLPPI
ncbi:MAG: VWA domain-containing protein [Candidatus Methanomethylicia archaeon]|nr:VWA domain-containing protein [Candidatus Methanomethylicia archaeon]